MSKNKPLGVVREDGHTARCSWDKTFGERVEPGKERLHTPSYRCRCPCHQRIGR